MRHVNIKVAGKVQGVFFRASAKATADALGIHGFVRNEPDGGVYIEAEGDEDSIAKFILWCQHGPNHANVSHCEVISGDSKSFQNFAIHR